MSLFDLEDRLNWRQASELLNLSRSAFYRLVEKGEIPAYGSKERGRIYLKSDCLEYQRRVKNRKAAKSRRGKKGRV